MTNQYFHCVFWKSLFSIIFCSIKYHKVLMQMSCFCLKEEQKKSTTSKMTKTINQLATVGNYVL